MIGENRIVFGEVLGVHVLDAVVSDVSKCQVASERMQLIGRMGGLGGYTRTTDVFQIPRKKYMGS
jgi:flavin reductase (DIM6/NTAB) family NADH-FMN oxidoreductase RutF